MKPIEHNRTVYRVVLMLVMILGLNLPGRAQTSGVMPEAAFVAYKCEFQPETNSARIRAVLMGSDGLPVRSDATVSVSLADSGEAMSPEKVTAVMVSNRPALQMIIVLDITDTVPIPEIVNSISNRLASQLEVLDEVALIAFSGEIAPPTQFYTDKNRLINEHMVGLQAGTGENRLYDAILEAVLRFPLDSDMRQAILVITDSGRREEEQESAATIVAEAIETDIQIYPIGFYSRDKPDDVELWTIANNTGGYAWIYDEVQNSRTSIATAVTDHLDDFVRAMNSEILLTVDTHGLEPDANRRVTFDIEVDAANEALLSDRISCPIELLNHSISFNDDGLEGATVIAPVDFGVSAESDMNLDETTVVFWIDDEIVQNSPDRVFTLNPANLYPQDYEVSAQLRDRYNQTLATTSTIRVSVQHILQLEIFDDSDTLSTGVTRFEATTNTGLDLPGVNLVVTSVADRSQSYPLNSAPVPFGEDGRAIWTTNDLPRTIRRLFPGMSSGDVQISAYIPNKIRGNANLAESNNVTFTLTSLPKPEPVRIDLDEYVPASILIALLALNLLFIRGVGQLRIRRLIYNPDDHELSQQLMSVTVKRDSGKQSHTLTKKTIYVGRGSTNDINLGDDADISRQHGMIMWRREGWYYSNRKRRLKTRINGKVRRGFVFCKLEPVTELEIGHVYLIFHSNAQRDLSDFITTNL